MQEDRPALVLEDVRAYYKARFYDAEKSSVPEIDVLHAHRFDELRQFAALLEGEISPRTVLTFNRNPDPLAQQWMPAYFGHSSIFTVRAVMPLVAPGMQETV
jgi:hypothetical protein